MRFECIQRAHAFSTGASRPLDFVPQFRCGRRYGGKVIFRAILASFGVKHNIRRSSLQALLRYLRFAGGEYADLPTDWRTLLRDRNGLKDKLAVKRIFVPVVNRAAVAGRGRRRVDNSSAIPASEILPLLTERRVGSYVHFGVLNGCIGQSPGCIKLFQQVRSLIPCDVSLFCVYCESLC